MAGLSPRRIVKKSLSGNSLLPAPPPIVTLQVLRTMKRTSPIFIFLLCGATTAAIAVAVHERSARAEIEAVLSKNTYYNWQHFRDSRGAKAAPADGSQARAGTFANAAGTWSITSTPGSTEKSNITIKPRSGEPWSCDVDSIVYEAQLLDSNVIAYYGYSERLLRQEDIEITNPPFAIFNIGAMRRDGKPVVRESFHRGLMLGSAQGTHPTGLSLIPALDGDSFIVCSTPESTRERSLHAVKYSISAGKCVGEVTGATLSQGRRELLHVRGFHPISAAPLCVVDWFTSGPGMAATVVDEDFNIICTIELPNDYKSVADTRMTVQTSRPEGGAPRVRWTQPVADFGLASLATRWPQGGVQCLEGDSAFSLYSMQRHERIKYGVARDAAGKWTVTPVYTEPVPPPLRFY